MVPSAVLLLLQLRTVCTAGYVEFNAPGSSSSATPYAGCGRPRGCARVARLPTASDDSVRAEQRMEKRGDSIISAMQWYSDARDLGSNQAAFEVALGRLHLGTPGVLKRMHESGLDGATVRARNDAIGMMQLGELHGLRPPSFFTAAADAAVDWSAAVHRAEGLRLLRKLAWGDDIPVLRPPGRTGSHEDEGYDEARRSGERVEGATWLGTASSWLLTGWSTIGATHGLDDESAADANADVVADLDDRVRLLAKEMSEGYHALYGTELGGRHTVLARRRRYYDSLAARYCLVHHSTLDYTIMHTGLFDGHHHDIQYRRTMFSIPLCRQFGLIACVISALADALQGGSAQSTLRRTWHQEKLEAQTEGRSSQRPAAARRWRRSEHSQLSSRCHRGGARPHLRRAIGSRTRPGLGGIQELQRALELAWRRAMMLSECGCIRS